MPKIIKSGIFSSEVGFPKNVPVGLKAHCHNCLAELETGIKEPDAKVSKKRDFRTGSIIPGWKIPCPECSAKVFFILDKIPKELFSLLNPLRL
jgi:hypothetical protein